MVATEQIKTRLHRLIDEETDPARLETIQAFLLGESPASGDFWDDLSEADKASIEAGIADADAGRVVSREEVKNNLIAQHLGQEEQNFREELTNLNAASNSFAFLADEEELYSLEDLKERYR